MLLLSTFLPMNYATAGLFHTNGTGLVLDQVSSLVMLELLGLSCMLGWPQRLGVGRQVAPFSRTLLFRGHLLQVAPKTRSAEDALEVVNPSKGSNRGGER